MDIRFQGREPLAELLREDRERPPVDGDPGDLHPRENGNERLLDLREDRPKSGRRCELPAERRLESERKARPGREVGKPRFRRERLGRREPLLPGQLLERRYRFRGEVEDATRIAREVVGVDPGRHDVAFEHDVDDARRRGDSESRRGEEKPLGVVSDDRHLPEERGEGLNPFGGGERKGDAVTRRKRRSGDERLGGERVRRRALHVDPHTSLPSGRGHEGRKCVRFRHPSERPSRMTPAREAADASAPRIFEQLLPELREAELLVEGRELPCPRRRRGRDPEEREDLSLRNRRVARHGRKDAGPEGVFLPLLQRLALLPGHLAEAGVDAVERAERRDQFARPLLADPGDARDVVRGVSHQSNTKPASV